MNAAFLQKYPDVKITEDFTNDFSTKLPVLVASGTPPDSTWDYQDWQDAAIKLNKYQYGAWTRIGGMMPSWWVIHYAGNHGQAIWQGGDDVLLR